MVGEIEALDDALDVAQGQLAEAGQYDSTTAQTTAVAAATEALNACQSALTAANGAADRVLAF